LMESTALLFALAKLFEFCDGRNRNAGFPAV